jgi:hypothetical protein
VKGTLSLRGCFGGSRPGDISLAEGDGRSCRQAPFSPAFGDVKHPTLAPSPYSEGRVAGSVEVEGPSLEHQDVGSLAERNVRRILAVRPEMQDDLHPSHDEAEAAEPLGHMPVPTRAHPHGLMLQRPDSSALHE